MFAVIEFDGEKDKNKTAVVRREWLTPAKKEVFWPPFKMSSHFNKALNDGAVPDEKVWTLFPVKRCLYYCDDILKAREKERLAEKDSDLQTTDNDGEESTKRKKRRIVKKNLSINGDTSSADDEQDRLPSSVRKNIFVSYPDAPDEDQAASCDALPGFDSPNKIASQPPKNFSSQSTATELVSTPSSSFERTLSDSGFSVVAKRLSKIESEISSIKEYLEDYLPRLESYTQSDKDQDKTNSIPPLPCMIKEDVEKLEEWLSERKNEETLIKFMARVGGRKVEHCVRKVLERIFSNDLAKNYNWTGKNNKAPLRGLKVVDVIFGVIRNNRSTSSSTDEDAERVIRNWFRFANDREGGREKRRGATSTSMS